MSIGQLILEPLQLGFMQRGLVAAILVGIVCAVMGAFVVLRGLAFIGDAVSHAAFPGLVIAFLLGIPLYIGGAIAAIATALGIGWIARRGELRFDTAVGVLFAGMFALGIVLFSTIDDYVADLFSYLLGNVLGITFADILQVTILGAIVLAVVFVLRKEFLYASFDPAGAAASGLPVVWLDYLLLGLIGVTIVVSIQTVGIVLVVAMLVTPAATGQLLVDRFWDLVRVAIAVATFSAVVGLYLSYYLNIASGASIVLIETVCFAVALVLSPKTGSARPPSPGARHDPVMYSPPSTLMMSPLMNPVPSPDSARIASATSCGVVIRPVGFRFIVMSIIVCDSGILSSAGVTVTPARMQLAVDAGPLRRELHRELADVRLERRLGRRHDAVRRHHTGRPLGGHRVDLRALAEEPAAPQVLDPVDEAVGHHVLGHLHLLAIDAGLGVLGQERHERAEGERVHHDPDVWLAALGARSLEPLAAAPRAPPPASRRRRRSC